MQLGFQPVNIMSAVAAMGRLVLADGNTVRVCSLEGSPVSVPGLHEPDGRGGTRPTWKERLAGALDNPRVMWDGSFLWISDIQLRTTQDNQVQSNCQTCALNISYGFTDVIHASSYSAQLIYESSFWLF